MRRILLLIILVLLCGVLTQSFYLARAATTWSETQPAGNTTKDWTVSSISSDGQVMLAGVSGGRLYRSTNSGSSWAEVQPAGNADLAWISAAVSSDGETMIAAISNGRVYRSIDGGDNWSETQPAGNTTANWYVVSISSNGQTMVAANSTRIYRSTNSGSSWSELQPLGNTNNNWRLSAVSGDGQTMLAGVYGGRLYLSTNGGSSWSETQPNGATNKNWTPASISSDGSVLLVGAQASDDLYLSTNQGSTWNNIASSVSAGNSWYLSNVSSDGQTMLAGVYGGRFYLSTNGGSNWSETQPAGDTTNSWYTSGMSSDGTIYLAGIQSGRLYLGSNPAPTPTPTPTPTSSGLSWTQSDWSGGSGQSAFTDETKYLSNSQTSSATANTIKLSASDVDTGDGADGAVTISSNKNINTDTMSSGRSCSDGGDAVNYSVTSSVSSGASSITLSSTPSSGCLTAGDEVLIINLQGTSGSYANVGKYETKTIASISTATLTFSGTLTNSYDGTTQKIMVQRIPNYTDVTVNSSTTLTASAWNGTKGGVLFFRASGTVTVTGSISASQLGYRGGQRPSTVNSDGYEGESYQGGYGNQNTNPGFGGGGAGQGEACAGYGSAGGGGAYGVSGSNGTTACTGRGGSTYGSSTLTTLYFGSGGGSGGNDNALGDNPQGGYGGLGGGIIGIAANTLSVTGSITASGQAGQGDNSAGCFGGSTTDCWDYSGPGGGGAGGSILLVGNTVTLGSSLVTASAGSGGLGGSTNAGAGGAGRIALLAPTKTGTTSPSYGTISPTYYTSGTLTSSIFDSEITTGVNWGTLTYSATTPTNTSVSVKVRTGNQADLSDATAFSACSAITSGSSVTANSCVASTHRYAQYQVTLTTSDTSVTPTFTNFSLTYADSPIPSSSSSSSNPGSACTAVSSQRPDLFQLDPASSSVTLYFVPVSGSDRYIISYGLSTSADRYSVSYANSDTSGALKYTVNGLSEGATYYFKVRGANGCSQGNWSDVKSVKTQNPTSFVSTFQTVVNTTAKKVAQVPVLEKTVDKKIEVTKSEMKPKKSTVAYIVQAGDTLWNIAQKVLGSGTEYVKILEQNIKQYPELLKHLTVGSKLEIEKDEPPIVDEKTSEKMYDLDVKVLASNNEPLRGVTVTLHSTPRTAVTDQEGIAHFKAVEGGAHKVYLAYGSYDGGGQSITVTGENKDIELVMQVDLKASFSPLAITVIGVLLLVIGVLLYLLIKKRKKESNRLPSEE